MSLTNSRESDPKRVSIIQAVQTPLGFFVLVVLVVEVIFGIITGLSEGSLRTILAIAMVTLIFLLAGFVSFLAYSRPEALHGVRYQPETNQGEKSIVKLQELIAQLQQENDNLKSELDHLNSIKMQIQGLLADGRSMTLEVIYRALISSSTKESVSRNAVMAAIGVLSDEGKIQGSSGYYSKTTN